VRQYGFYLFRVWKTAGGRLLYERIEAGKSLVHELSRPRHSSVAIFHGITTDSISSGKPRPKPVFTPGQAKDHRPIGGGRKGRETPAQPYYRPPCHAPAERPPPTTPHRAFPGCHSPLPGGSLPAPPRHCHSPLEIQTIPPDLAPEKGGRSMYCTLCGRQSVMAPSMSPPRLTLPPERCRGPPPQGGAPLTTHAFPRGSTRA